jgi:1-acyl-sn-glycerol-3-phosphate acyltransferase
LAHLPRGLAPSFAARWLTETHLLGRTVTAGETNSRVSETLSPSRRPTTEVRAPRRGKLFRFLWPITSYLVTNITVTLFWMYFFILNRTTVIGRKNVGEQRNTLLLSNHQSMIDSFLVGLATFYPKSWIKPYLQPWNPAALENFYGNPLLAWLAENWKCIPVREGRRDLRALHRMAEVLPNGVMTLFPEGTRTRDGSVRKGRAGAGLVVLSTQPRVIPVAILGMNRVLPIGRVVPKVFQRIYVSYGQPVDCSEWFGMPRTRETAQLVVDRVMHAIRSQHAELRRIAGAKGAGQQ